MRIRHRPRRPPAETMADLLRDQRLASLAPLVGCAMQTLYDWRRGETQPHVRLLARLAAVLGLPLRRVCDAARESYRLSHELLD